MTRAARILPLPAADAPRSERATDSARVHAWLRSRILDMSLLPGAALAEGEIAARFGTSRTPVREALLRLADEGLIDIRPQRGTYVSRLRVDRLEEALFLRTALEGALLRELAARADHAAVARRLAAPIEQQEAAIARGDVAGTLAGDAAFHRALVAECGRPGLWEIIGKARDGHHRLRALAAPEATNASDAVADHRAIVRAIRSGNGDLAHRRIAIHLDRNRALARALVARFPAYFE